MTSHTSRKPAKRHLALVLCTAALGLTGLAGAAGIPAASGVPVNGLSSPVVATATTEVTISNFKFGPQTMTVPVGTTVKWTNRDSAPHDVASTTGVFRSPRLNNGGTYQYTFTKAGDYPYYCTIHPSMRATVKVQ
jgi:plastocyanin